MDYSRHFQGKVQIIDPITCKGRKKPVKNIEFEFQAKKLEMTEILMSHFSHLELSHEEKKNLTFKHRELIAQIENIPAKQIQKYSNALVNELKQFKNKSVTIKASHLGAYICLSAIFSGKVPVENDWQFELSSVPLKLFPEMLVKENRAALSQSIHFQMEKDCWMKPFKSLYACPEYLQFDTLMIEDDSFEKMVA